MKVSVIGLGKEGENAVKSLLNYGCHVYASDINENIDLTTFDDYIEYPDKGLDIDLGHHDLDKIHSSDAVVISPGLWNLKMAEKIRSQKKLLSDVFKKHESIFTVGVTGTNGKTTTCFMIKEILEKKGLKVLVGGNAGGGFQGYTQLILEAELGKTEQKYDVMVVEVCDMTLDFSRATFNLDVVVVTNVGTDHMDFHVSLENYCESVCRFLKDKKAVLNGYDVNLRNLGDCADETLFFEEYAGKLNVFGKFNRQNAGAASEIGKILGATSDDITTALGDFKGVEGRTKLLEVHGSRVLIGKTDNADATSAVLTETHFDVVMIGTPRKGELCRFDTLRKVSKANPSVLALFPGLDDTVDAALKILKNTGYSGEVKILEDVSEVVDFTLKLTKVEPGISIFIGGNGQDKITEIQKKLYPHSKDKD
ncbi:Mur ligase family protein [Methanobacterium congolense]|uniref:UDP-N-acetylmuramoyl-L-alanine-D-glutamate ligase n=1 Tax=Methanobacterium congolense TaxID=118062 RepID=A0A1D3L0A4_9EURY|nr:Mur ligase family protein [Methanobacterium congolense]SCG84976.1 UDP-N-acetylmuramoyl-L-alanine-D-glutamate ligase [Methanobacterium congolense]